MTEKQLRQLVVDTAKKYEGYNELSGTHRAIIDAYNAATVGYNVTYTDAWCATFVSFVGIKAGLSDIIFSECSCGRMIDLYKAKSRWMEADNYTPQPGDVIMYDWQDNGSGDNGGWPDHVGIVVSVSGGKIKVIEGNNGNAVAYRTIAVNAQYIRGYCLPDYASKAGKSEAKQDKPAASATKPAETPKPSTGTATPSGAKKATDAARAFNASLAGLYYVTASQLNVRHGAGTGKAILTTIPKSTPVRCYGYYTACAGVKWLYVQFKQGGVTYSGFASSAFLTK